MYFFDRRCVSIKKEGFIIKDMSSYDNPIFATGQGLPLPVFDIDNWIPLPFEGVGAQGMQGLQGLQGMQGLIGTQGYRGFQALEGLQGFQGLTGVQGLDGAQGLQGYQGGVGFQGEGQAGVQGVTGPTGGGSSYTILKEYLNIGATAEVVFDNIPASATQLLFPHFGIQGNGSLGFQVGDGTTGYYSVGYTGCAITVQTSGDRGPFNGRLVVRQGGFATRLNNIGTSHLYKVFGNYYNYFSRGMFDAGGGNIQFFINSGVVELPNTLTQIRFVTASGDVLAGNMSCLYK